MKQTKIKQLSNFNLYCSDGISASLEGVLLPLVVGLPSEHYCVGVVAQACFVEQDVPAVGAWKCYLYEQI